MSLPSVPPLQSLVNDMAGEFLSGSKFSASFCGFRSFLQTLSSSKDRDWFYSFENSHSFIHSFLSPHCGLDLGLGPEVPDEEA